MHWFKKMTPGETASNDRERLLNFSDSALKESIFSKDSDETKVYKKRWYILAMFSLLCLGQGIVYNTWSPIQSTARAVYKWDSFMIDLMPALGCIAPCFTIVPLGWLMDVKGMCKEVSRGEGAKTPRPLLVTVAQRNFWKLLGYQFSPPKKNYRKPFPM
jgi:hypothetical protein